MAKLALSFADFQAAVAAKGFTATQQGNSVYFIKSAKGGKVEVNTHSATYTVGAGLKPEVTDKIVAAATADGFTLVKRPTGWAVLNFIDMDRFFDLIEIVDSTIPEKAPKAAKEPKAPKVQAESLPVGQAETTKTPEEVAAIKEANLAKMKEVAAKLKNAKKAKKDEPTSEAQEPTLATDSFQAPETLTADEVRSMV